MITKTVTIKNKLGLHARAAAKFVALASKFCCNIEVSKESKKVNGKSIMGVMMLAARKGTDIELHIDGDDEQAAMDAMVDLIDNLFGEGE